MTKQCTKCKEFKELDKFGINNKVKCGLRSCCKTCRTKDSRKWQRLNTDKVKNKNLERQYGISIEVFNEMLSAQNFVCAICKQPETAIDSNTGQYRSLAVDHCHKTEKVRGLLCTGCNAALGFIKENVDSALNLAKYIKHHEDNNGYSN